MQTSVKLFVGSVVINDRMRFSTTVEANYSSEAALALAHTELWLKLEETDLLQAFDKSRNVFLRDMELLNPHSLDSILSFVLDSTVAIEFHSIVLAAGA